MFISTVTIYEICNLFCVCVLVKEIDIDNRVDNYEELKALVH